MEQTRLLNPTSTEAAYDSDSVVGFDASQRGEGSPSWRPRLATGLLAVVALGALAWLGHRGGLSEAPVRTASRADVDRVARADEEATAGRHAAHAGTATEIDSWPAPRRSLTLTEGEWRKAVEQMHRGAMGRAAGGNASAQEMGPPKAKERAEEVAVVEPIAVVAGGAPGQRELGCSEVGEDCSGTRCCTAEGHRCYEKDRHWASCMPACSRRSGSWSCAELGERTPLEIPGSCSAPSESCLLTRCCTEPGMQCYLMDENAYWGSCAYDCKPGVGWAENWTCEELGERAPDPLGCAWSGEACIWNKLCCDEGQRCVRKNDVEAYCTDLDTSELEEGWNGEVIGGSRNEYAVLPVAPEEARGTSLYCFMAVLPGSFEEQLKDLAAEKGASIFACDASTVFWSRQADFTSDGSSASVVNADSINVWGEVKRDGRYLLHDWAVKVDPDSVFFPDRLKQHLQNLNAPKEMPIYVKSMRIGSGSFGAIDVFSKEALDKLFLDGVLERCERRADTHSGGDGYIKDCMDMIGAGSMEDIDALGNPSADGCTDSARVCFHAYEDIGAWERCYNQALRAGPPGGKVAKWVKDTCSGGLEDCSRSRCCKQPGHQCYLKNEFWGTCRENCTKGVDPYDNEIWSCERVGPRSWGLAMKGWPSLYCWALVRVKGYENVIIRMQAEASVGIFACDGHGIVADGAMQRIGQTVNMRIDVDQDIVGVSSDGTAANTLLFIVAWRAIIRRGDFDFYDWTLKIDPDTVILPDRVRAHLLPHTGKGEGEQYVLNCNAYPDRADFPMMYGPLEAFSRKAVRKYAWGHNESCVDGFHWQHWGEDVFMVSCMNALGVSKVNDFKIIGDNNCVGHGHSGADCSDGQLAAFHPFKDARSWAACFRAATGRLLEVERGS